MSTPQNSDWPDEEAPRKKFRPRVIEGDARQTPFSIEAEEFLLSSLMLDGRDVMARCHAAKLTGASFYVAAHGMIFEALEELYRRGEPMEVGCVAEELRQRKQLEAAGNYAFLTQVSAKIPTTAQAWFFIEKVRDLAVMRSVITGCSRVVEGVYGLTGGGTELSERLEVHAGWVSRQIDLLRAGGSSMLDAAKAAYERTLAKIAGKPDKSRWLFTGLSEFDTRFGPFDANNEDWLVVIGGFQGSAKSSFLRWVTLQTLRAGKTAQIFLLETGIGKFLELMACTAAGINARRLHELTSEEKARYGAALDEMHGYLGKTLWLSDDVLPVETLVARIDDHARRFGAADMIGVDHIHLLRSLNNFKAREAEMGFIAKALARCGKRINRTIFGLAQLNRSARTEGGNRRPQSHDIRDSGEIEQAARRIVLLHTPDKDMRGAEQTDNQSLVMTEIIQAKHNNGRVGHREFWFRRDLTSFKDVHDGELVAPAGGQQTSTRATTKGEYRKRGTP